MTRRDRFGETIEVTETVERDWRAARTWLERRHAATWAQKQELVLTDDTHTKRLVLDIQPALGAVGPGEGSRVIDQVDVPELPAPSPDAPPPVDQGASEQGEDDVSA